MAPSLPSRRLPPASRPSRRIVSINCHYCSARGLSSGSSRQPLQPAFVLASRTPFRSGRSLSRKRTLLWGKTRPRGWAQQRGRLLVLVGCGSSCQTLRQVIVPPSTTRLLIPLRLQAGPDSVKDQAVNQLGRNRICAQFSRHFLQSGITSLHPPNHSMVCPTAVQNLLVTCYLK